MSNRNPHIGVSVLILTLNEETNLGECLDCCSWCDDIVVFDSLSTDRTREIALARGARVIERQFDDYASQRNAALQTVNYAHSWVMIIDADERIPTDLVTEITDRIETVSADTVMFRMRRKDFFMGRWLRRSSGYPTWFGRLVRIGRVRVERAINEEYIADGRVEHLKSHLHHYPFNKGIAFWYERHNRYSTLEAAAKVSSRHERIRLGAIFGSDPTARRRSLKQIAYRLPCRPNIIFIYLYIFRLGILDGRPGWYFSRMRAAYEMSIDLKVLELERRQNLQSV